MSKTREKEDKQEVLEVNVRIEEEEEIIRKKVGNKTILGNVKE